MTYYPITPCPAPRQVRSDRWNERPCVMRYRAFKDEVRARNVQIPPLPSVIFYMPMPKSWSRKKKEELRGAFHTQKPDWDNLAKALCDAVYDEDSHIPACLAIKVWADEGGIDIAPLDTDLLNQALNRQYGIICKRELAA